jgi:hypothetical protein
MTKGPRRNHSVAFKIPWENPQNDQVFVRQEPRKMACKTWDHSLGFDPGVADIGHSGG